METAKAVFLPMATPRRIFEFMNIFPFQFLGFGIAVLLLIVFLELRKKREGLSWLLLKSNRGFASSLLILSSALVFIVLEPIGFQSLGKNSNSNCQGNGDASCEGAVMAHINGIQDKEVNFINYIGDGRFSVNIIDVSNGGLAVGGSYSKNVRTDCNCTIVGF